MIYLYNEMLLSNKKEQPMDTFNNLDKSQKYCAKWKKSYPKLRTVWFNLCEFIFWEMQNYRDKQQISICQGTRKFWAVFEGTALFLDYDSDYKLCPNSQKCTLKRVNFTVCELHIQEQILKENLLRVSS